MDRESTGRRIKAARSLTDLTVPQLAERLDLPGLGAKTLGSIERGERALRPQEVAPIAQALGVPETFLTGENPAGETQLDRIERRLERIELMLLGKADSMLVRGDVLTGQLDRLERALTGAISESVTAETEEWKRLAQELVQGRSSEGQTDSLPAPQRTAAARSKRAAKSRTP